MQRRRNLKLQGVTRHGAHATRHAALATSVLLFLLLTSAAALAAAPAWVTSSGNVAFTTVTLEWTPVAGADSYNLAVADCYDLSQPALNVDTAGTSHTVTGLADNHAYFASVQAYSIADGASDWSLLYFGVCSTGTAPSDQPVLTAPRPLSDADPGNPLDVTFTWAHVAEAGRYWLCVNEWHNTYWTTVFAVIVPDTGPGTTISYGPVTLEEGHYYGAVLLSSNPVGQGPYSDCLYFGVSTLGHAPDQPTLTQLATTYSDEIPLSNIVFQWSSTAKTLGYYYVLYDEDANVLVGTWWAFDPGTEDPLSFTLPSNITLVEGDSYWFSVQGWNPWGFGTGTIIHFIPGLPPDPNTGPVWTTPTTNPVGTSPTGVSPNNGVQPAFSWTTVDHATDYWVFVNEYQPETNSWPTVWYVSRAALDASTQSWTVPSDHALSPGRRYGAYIRGYSRLGDSDWSGMLDFTVAAPLTISADAKSKFYGAANPALTCTYTGLVNGDTSASFTGALSTTASTGSPVGNYPISEATLAATGYYYIGTFNGANLTVLPDTTPPAISIWYPNNGVVLLGIVSIGGEITDSGSGVNWSTLSVTLNGMGYGASHEDEDSFFCCEPSYLADGVYSLAVSVYDNAYNHATAYSTFTLDTTPPTIDYLGPADGSTAMAPDIFGGAPMVLASYSDAGSGINITSVKFYLDNVLLTAQNTSDIEVAENCAYAYVGYVSEGPHSIKVSVSDCAGKTGTQTNQFTVVPLAGPLVVITPSYGQLPVTWTANVYVFTSTSAAPTDVTAQCTIAWSGGPATGAGPITGSPSQFQITGDSQAGNYLITATATNIPNVPGGIYNQPGGIYYIPSATLGISLFGGDEGGAETAGQYGPGGGTNGDLVLIPSEIWVGVGETKSIQALYLGFEEGCHTATVSSSTSAVGTPGSVLLSPSGSGYFSVSGKAVGTSTVTVTLNGPTGIANCSVHVVQVTINGDLWWFNGESPSGYIVAATLTANGVSSGCTWEIVAGSDKVSLSGASGNTVTVTSTGTSAGANEVKKDLDFGRL